MSMISYYLFILLFYTVIFSVFIEFCKWFFFMEPTQQIFWKKELCTILNVREKYYFKYTLKSQGYKLIIIYRGFSNIQ